MSQKIVFTGGGTAGHVTPNLALIEALQARNWTIDYIGSNDGIEKKMITAISIPYHAILCGKLRRYFSWKNVIDPIKMLIGIMQAYCLLRKIKPNIVFSKGGFVAFPVVVGAWFNGTPVIAHESDLSPGLANRLSYPFVNKICVTFAAGKNYFKHQDKVIVTGTPIREALLAGDKAKGLDLCGFATNKPCLLILGGSQGSNHINQCIRQTLTQLSPRFQVIHLCGKGNLDGNFMGIEGYYQCEYAQDDLAHLFAAADHVISRAGANSLYEILALEKPHILIPLSKKASRGDQIQNAQFFKKQGISIVIEEEALNSDTLLSALDCLIEQQETIIAKIRSLQIESATLNITELIEQYGIN